MHSSTVWQRHHSKPEVLYRLYHLDELLKIDWLDDVAVGVEPIGFEDVFLGLGGRQDHHGNRAHFLRHIWNLLDPRSVGLPLSTSVSSYLYSMNISSISIFYNYTSLKR